MRLSDTKHQGMGRWQAIYHETHAWAKQLEFKNGVLQEE
jgi:hypothetical protein